MSNKALWQYPLAKLSIALIAGVLLVGGSFLVAGYTQHIDQLFALSPTVPSGVTVPQLDILSSEKIYFFHTTIYTIWATILLSLPAFCTVWFIREGEIVLSKVIGVASACVVIIALVVGFVNSRRNSVHSS